MIRYSQMGQRRDVEVPFVHAHAAGSFAWTGLWDFPCEWAIQGADEHLQHFPVDIARYHYAEDYSAYRVSDAFALLRRLEAQITDLRAELERVRQVLVSTLPKESASQVHSLSTLQARFLQLSGQWHEDTDALSSPSSIVSDDSYLKIIALGKETIPLILLDLRERGGDWYKALRILADANPVLPEHEGFPALMDEDWLTWGRDRGYM